MKRNKIALLILSISIILGLIPFAISQTSIEVQEVSFDPRANVTIPENRSGNLSLGVAPGREGLDYGKLPQGPTKSAEKTLDLSAPKKSLVLISSSGNASEYLDYDEKHYFKGDQQVRVDFRTEESGYFTGDLTLKILSPKNKIGGLWLDLRSQLYF